MKNGKKKSQLLRIEEVMDRLSVGRTKVWSLISSGHLQAVRLVGRITRVEEAALEAFIETGRNRAPRVTGAMRKRIARDQHNAKKAG